jgi:hypothetical protein
MSVLLFACAVAVGIIAWILGQPWYQRRRRQALQRQRLPVAWRELLQQQSLYRRVPQALRARLDGLVRIFVAEKDFVGCNGLDIDLPMRLAIAVPACLLILNRDAHVFDRLRTILVYPDEFIVTDSREDEHGIVTTGPQVLAGQAWDQSRIVLSWRDVRDRGRGYNVVIHEFAHYLDQEDGAVNGAPLLDGSDSSQRWAAVMQPELDKLRLLTAEGTATLLDPYAAQDEGEFFAVASEVFVELPRELRAQHPALYAALAGFYRLDPAAW